jgi:hypothetical protein
VKAESGVGGQGGSQIGSQVGSEAGGAGGNVSGGEKLSSAINANCNTNTLDAVINTNFEGDRYPPDRNIINQDANPNNNIDNQVANQDTGNINSDANGEIDNTDGGMNANGDGMNNNATNINCDSLDAAEFDETARIVARQKRMDLFVEGREVWTGTFHVILDYVLYKLDYMLKRLFNNIRENV